MNINDELRKAFDDCTVLPMIANAFECVYIPKDAATAVLEDVKAENAKLRELCEWLLTPYRLGAVTGEGVDRQWCRETYDGGSYRLRELGIEVDA